MLTAAGAAPPARAGMQNMVNENGQPLILQYAGYLGMDPIADSDLLWIAQQAMTAELPAGWTEHADPMSGDSYFHNGSTGETVPSSKATLQGDWGLGGGRAAGKRPDCLTDRFAVPGCRPTGVGAPVRRVLPKPVRAAQD